MEHPAGWEPPPIKFWDAAKRACATDKHPRRSLRALGVLVQSAQYARVVFGASWDSIIEWLPPVGTADDWITQQRYTADDPYPLLMSTEIHYTDVFGVRVVPRKMYEYSSLTAVHLSKITALADRAFACCGALHSVQCGDVETVGKAVFIGCSSLRYVDLPKARSLGAEAFALCADLGELVLPAAEEVGAGLVMACHKLTRLELPKVKTIPSKMAMGCSMLRFARAKPVTIHRHAFEGTMVRLHRCDLFAGSVPPGSLDESSLSFSRCKRIHERAFAYLRCEPKPQYRTLHLPVATTLGPEAFRASHVYVAILPKVTTIGERCFIASRVAKIYAGAVKEIKSQAFAACELLCTTVGPEGEDECLPPMEGACREPWAWVSFPKCTTVAKDAFSSCKMARMFHFPLVSPPSVPINHLGRIYVDRASWGKPITHNARCHTIAVVELRNPDVLPYATYFLDMPAGMHAPTGADVPLVGWLMCPLMPTNARSFDRQIAIKDDRGHVQGSIDPYFTHGWAYSTLLGGGKAGAETRPPTMLHLVMQHLPHVDIIGKCIRLDCGEHVPDLTLASLVARCYAGKPVRSVRLVAAPEAEAEATESVRWAPGWRAQQSHAAWIRDDGKVIRVTARNERHKEAPWAGPAFRHERGPHEYTKITPHGTTLDGVVRIECSEAVETLTNVPGLGPAVYRLRRLNDLQAVDCPSVQVIGKGVLTRCPNLRLVAAPNCKMLCAGSLCDAHPALRVQTTSSSVHVDTSESGRHGRMPVVRQSRLCVITDDGPDDEDEILERLRCAGVVSVNIHEWGLGTRDVLFAGMRNLTTVHVGGLVRMPKGMLSCCKQLVLASFPDMTTIESGFGGCVRLRRVVAPSTTYIHINAFTHTPVPVLQIDTSRDLRVRRSCTDVYDSSWHPSSMTRSLFRLFDNCLTAKFDSVEVTNGHDELAYRMNVTQVRWRQGPSELKDEYGAFCTRLVVVDISIKQLPNRAFYGCVQLRTVTLPDTEVIDGAAFGSCESLVEISAPRLSYLRWNALAGCSSLSVLRIQAVERVNVHHPDQVADELRLPYLDHEQSGLPPSFRVDCGHFEWRELRNGHRFCAMVDDQNGGFQMQCTYTDCGVRVRANMRLRAERQEGLPYRRVTSVVAGPAPTESWSPAKHFVFKHYAHEDNDWVQTLMLVFQRQGTLPNVPVELVHVIIDFVYGLAAFAEDEPALAAREAPVRAGGYLDWQSYHRGGHRDLNLAHLPPRVKTPNYDLSRLGYSKCWRS